MATIRVRVTPRSSRSEIVGFQEGVAQIKLSAPPVDGEANKALIELIAKSFGVPKSRVSVRSGSSSRTKTLQIDGLEQSDLEAKCQNFNA